MPFKTLKVKYTSLVLFQSLLDLSLLLGVEFLKLNNQVSDTIGLVQNDRGERKVRRGFRKYQQALK